MNRTTQVSLPAFERPLRIPEGVECLIADPPVARAGEAGCWNLPFALSEAVPAGQEIHLLFDGGRNVKGSFRPLHGGDEEAAGYVTVRVPADELSLPVRSVEAGLLAFPAPAGGLRRGERLEVTVRGATAPHLDLLSKMILLYLPQPDEHTAVPVINSEAAKKVIGACLLHVTGANLAGLRVHAPSQGLVGEPFALLVRGEDRYRNVACERPGELVLCVNGAVIEGWRRRDLPDAACVWIEGLELEGTGVVRLEVEDKAKGLAAWSNPIRCTAAESPVKHYWGMIHAHTEHSDGIATVDHYFTYLRDENALDFGALADHDHLYETSEAMWVRAQEATCRYHEPGRFVTFLGYEWAKWRQNGDGDRNVYYLEDDRPMFRSDDGEYPTPGALFAALRSEIALVVPHHPANRGNHCDWKDSDPQIERLVEIFSEWGSSECSVNDGNPYAMKTLAETPEQLDSGEVAAGFVQTALALGRRIGFTAGGDDHQGHPGDLTLRPGSPPRASGLMAVRATTRTREAIWKALHDRHCYGTTGARIIVDFAVDGAPMGSELWLDEQPALAQGRTLEVAAHGTADFAKIEIVRNNQVVHTHCPAAPDASFAWEDTLPFEAIALPPALHWPTPFCFYYLRLTQTDGEMAWVSPVWVSAKP